MMNYFVDRSPRSHPANRRSIALDLYDSVLLKAVKILSQTPFLGLTN